jgi:hypothetical protein
MQVTFDEIREEVSEYFHGSRDVLRLEEDELKRVDAAILGGLRRFYTPSLTIPNCRHRWTFLRIIQQIVTVANQHAYTMPADFGGFYGPLSYAEGDDAMAGTVKKVSEHIIRESFSGGTQTTGRPAMYCQRAKGGLNVGTQLTEVDLWPSPDGVYTLTAPANLNPVMLTAGRGVPHGGQEHSLTILLACKAEAEIRDVGPGVYNQQFVQALAGSLEFDRMQHAPDLIGYNGRGGPMRQYSRINGELTLGY